MRSACLKLHTLVLLSLVILASLLIASASPTIVVTIELRGRIDEGSYYLVKKGVDSARGGVVILVIDSYGGYLSSMDKIVNLLVTSEARTIAWVPPGGKASSAAAVIAFAADKLYVGKGSVLGSVKPYPEDPKIVEYLVARISSLLSVRGVNDSRRIAERLVKEAVSFTDTEAIKLGIAHDSADSLGELLSKENIASAEEIHIAGDVLSDFLSILLDPAIAILLLLLGVLLIFLEFKTAGIQGWGILGAAFVIISLYSLNIIGVNITSFILTILGIALIIVEFMKPGIQLAGISGVALIVTALVLEYTSRPYPMFTPSIALVAIPLTILTTLLAIVISKALEVMRMKVPTLQERLVGKVGYAKTNIPRGGRGIVHVEGEDWSATSETEIAQGSKVAVTGIENLTLKVKLLEETRENSGQRKGL
jgi:membrane-bound serine protease (ClpP class)